MYTSQTMIDLVTSQKRLAITTVSDLLKSSLVISEEDS